MLGKLKESGDIKTTSFLGDIFGAISMFDSFRYNALLGAGSRPTITRNDDSEIMIFDDENTVLLALDTPSCLIFKT